MNFAEIIKESPLYTFHSHTQYCDGRATMGEMAEAAVRLGFRHYGFTPHSPLPIESPCNMAETDVPAYLAEVEAIRNNPAFKSCTFYAGMEVDYLNSEWGPAHEYFHRPGFLDYIIGSVHFIPSQEGVPVDIDGRFENFRRRMSEFFHEDIEYVVDTFYRSSEAMIEAGGFDILGHFDKIGQNASYYHPGIENSSFYRGYIDRMLNLIARHRPVVELNTKARAEHGRFFPSEYALGGLIDSGITIVVNSDAHTVAGINASRDEALALIEKYSRK